MAKLSAPARKRLPGKDFAGPGRSFPIEDKAHARAALRTEPRAQRAGSVTPAEGSKIKAAARRKLGQNPRAGARDGLGHGQGGMAVHASAKDMGIHTDKMMRDEPH